MTDTLVVKGPRRSKDSGPRSEHAPLKVRVTDAERIAIHKTARAVRLPVSALLRKLALGYQPSSRIDQETFLELFRLRGDLGRIGGLLKLWLVEEAGNAVPESDVREALDIILERQAQVADLLAEMRTLIRGQ